MNKKFLLIFLFFIVITPVFIFGGALVLQYYLNKEGNSNINVIEKDQEKTEFIKYTNIQLGFSIDFPKEISAVYRCSPFKNFMSPVKIFEDIQNSSIYIAPEYYYDKMKENEDNSCEIKYYSKDALIEETFKNDAAWPNLNIKTYKPAIGWAIIVANAENEKKLEIIIKNMFGEGCGYKKENWKQDGVYKISFQEANKENINMGNTNCPTNYDYRLLYVPLQQKIIFLKMGQDCTFFDAQKNNCYDNTIVESFLVL